MNPKFSPWRLTLAIALLVLIAAYFVYLLSEDQPPIPQDEQQDIPPSESLAPSEPEPQPEPLPFRTGELLPSTSAVNLKKVQEGKKAAVNIVLRAENFPVRLTNFSVANGETYNLAASSDCPMTGELQRDTSCSLTLIWNPDDAFERIDTTLSISAISSNTAGLDKAINITIPITGQVKFKEPEPDQTPPDRTMRVAPEPEYTPAALQALAARGTIDFTHGGIAKVTNVPGQARYQDANWQDIGVQETVSSLPVKMDNLLLKGTPISAATSIPIDARKPSPLRARVDRNIYTTHGRNIALPRGSLVIGYTTAVSQASELKVDFYITDIIRPDGARFNLTGNGGDAMGRIGGLGYANNRNPEKYGFVLAKGVLNAASLLLLGGTQQVVQQGDDAVIANDSKAQAGAVLTNALNQISDDYFEQKSQLPPIRIIPRGTRITVYADTDLIFKKQNEMSYEQHTTNPNENQENQYYYGPQQQQGTNPNGPGQQPYNGNPALTPSTYARDVNRGQPNRPARSRNARQGTQGQGGVNTWMDLTEAQQNDGSN